MRTNYLLLSPVAFIRIFFLVLSLTVGGFTFGSFGIANANATSSSSAFGESVDLELLPLLGNGIEVLSGPLPLVSSSAPPAYIKKQQPRYSNSLRSSVRTNTKNRRTDCKRSVLVPGSIDHVRNDAIVNKLELDVISSLILKLLSIDALYRSIKREHRWNLRGINVQGDDNHRGCGPRRATRCGKNYSTSIRPRIRC